MDQDQVHWTQGNPFSHGRVILFSNWDRGGRTNLKMKLGGAIYFCDGD
jgi:hypothetical protein